jgi:hypothetical protein
VPPAKDDTVSRYTVVSFNNAHAGQGGAAPTRSQFDSGEEALAHANALVDQALLQLGAAASAHELMALYGRRGSHVPMIYGEPRIPFHAYQCAREKANAMFGPPD